MRFSLYLPKLAKLADRLTVVQSFRTKHPEHNGAHKQLMTADLAVQDGKPITKPGIGAIYARAAGSVNPTSGLPRHSLIPTTTRNSKGRAGFNGAFESVVEGCQPAGLGAAFGPFDLLAPLSDGFAEEKKKRKPGEEGPPNPLDVFDPKVPTPQLNARLGLLRELDRYYRAADAAGAMNRHDEFTRQAAGLLQTGGVRKALDMSLEDPATIKAYDTEQFLNWNCDDNSKFIRSGPSVVSSLGRQVLLGLYEVFRHELGNEGRV